MYELSDNQNNIAGFFLHCVENDRLEIIPAKNKSTGRVEMVVITYGEEDDNGKIDMILIGRLFDVNENNFDTYDFGVEFEEESPVIYQKDTLWNKLFKWWHK